MSRDHDALVADMVASSARMPLWAAVSDFHYLTALGRRADERFLGRRWRWPARDVARFLARAEWALGCPSGGEA